MSFRHVFVLLAVATSLSHCQMDESTSELTSTTTKVYCGNNLSQTLSTVCRGNYNTLYKKSNTQKNPDGSEDMDYPFQGKTTASTLMSQYRRRRKRGVFNECCEKACSQEELSSYCGSRKRRRIT